MKLIFLRLGLLVALLTLVSCSKKAEAPAAAAAKSQSPSSTAPATVELVKENERSKTFLAVQKQLELGGTLYGYVDIDGDVLKITTRVQSFLAEMAKTQRNLAPFAQQDLAAIVQTLGLTDVKALGASSVPDGMGFYRNRVFIYTGGERHGLMAGLGGKPAPFKHVNLAPADAAIYVESEADFAVIYKTLKEVVTKVAGEPMGNQLESTLKKAGEAASLSFLDLIHGLKGSSAIVVRIDPEKTIRTPGPQGIVLPAFSLVLRVDGIGGVLDSSLAKSRELKRTERGTQHVYELVQRLPIEGVQPALVVDGSTLFVTTSLPFLDECRTQKTGLAQAPEFQRALEQVGTEGNGLTYVSPKFFDHVRRIEALNPQIPAEQRSVFQLVLADVPKPDRPLVAVRTNLDDGILLRAHWHRSMKQDMATLAVYNPVTIGLFAAMAVPAFQKVRTASQDKAVLNNLRQLAAAADQYYLENGVRSATYDQLVGPTRTIKVLQPVAGENYRALRFQQGQPLRVRLADGRVVEYAP